MLLAVSAQSQGNPVLAQFVFSVASGLTVVILAYIARMLRKFMGGARLAYEADQGQY